MLWLGSFERPPIAYTRPSGPVAPISVRLASANVTNGESVAKKCLACHTVGEGDKLGPDVAGVTKRRSKEWLARWLKEPEKMLQTDADAKALLKEYNNIPMPNQNLTDAEIKQYLKYFEWIDAQPAGAVKPAAAGH